jgi:hypothetical protein
MMRPSKYANRQGVAAAPAAAGHDADLPEVGCFRIVLRRGAPASAIRIWLGHPHDPETGTEMLERPFAWQAAVNGQPVDLWNYWPGCAREAISREEHDRIVERNRTMDPESPFYDARKPIDLGRAPPPF